MITLIFDLVSNTGRLAIASIAIDGAEQLLATRVWENERSHAEFLVQHINDSLAETGRTYADIARIGIVHGPGSFTGMRIAISCAKALHLTTRAPVVCVNTLEQWGLAAAYQNPNTPILVAQDVRRSELAVQLFTPEGVVISPLCHSTIGAVTLPEGQFYAVGSGIAALASQFSEQLIPQQISDSHLLEALAHLTAIADPSDNIAPYYIRAADATLPKAMLIFTHE